MNIINLTGKYFPLNTKRLDIYDNLPLEWGMNFFRNVYNMGAIDIYEQQMQYSRLMTIWKNIPIYLVSDIRPILHKITNGAFLQRLLAYM